MVIKRNGLTYKGTKITYGEEPELKRYLLNECVRVLTKARIREISMPAIHYLDTFASKVGNENRNMMFKVVDRSDRELVLAPEYTAVVQDLAKTTFKNDRDVRLFYIAECFRGENTQHGRWRQFTQLGVEIVNPHMDYSVYLQKLAKELIAIFYTPLPYNMQDEIISSITVDDNAKRGMDYYTSLNGSKPEGIGFEIHCNLLGTASQVCGGGRYDGGIGFALGIDRLMMLKTMVSERRIDARDE